MKDDYRRRSKSTSGSPDVRLAVTGGPKVGKSAISVRFLTKRFIGEYQRSVERIYRRSMQFGNDVIEYDLKDSSDVRDNTSTINWATCVAIVYSITDRTSFMVASALLDEIDILLTLNEGKHNVVAPCLALLGNKKDLDHLREISNEEGKNLARKYGAGFWEISASEDYHSTYGPLNALIVESYLNVLTAKNTDSNAVSLPATCSNSSDKQRAHSDCSLPNPCSSDIDFEFENFEQRKNFFKKQEEDAISTTSTSSMKRRKKSEFKKHQQVDGRTEPPTRPRKLSVGKFSLDSSGFEYVSDIDTPDGRNESTSVADQNRSNSWSKKDKKRGSIKKSSGNKPQGGKMMKSRSYSDLKSFEIEQNEKKALFTPQLTRVKRLANEIDKHGTYKDRTGQEELLATPAALLSPTERLEASSFTKLSTFGTGQARKPDVSPKPKRERRKTVTASPTDENGNLIGLDKSTDTERVSSIKVKRAEQKKSVRRKLSSIFRPKIVIETP